MKTIKLMAMAALFAIGFEACEKSEEGKIQEVPSVSMGSVHNEIENSVLTSDSKFKLTSTVDVAKGSIVLWSGGLNRSVQAGNLIGACFQDAATYNAIMSEASSMGIGSYAGNVAIRAGAYASVCFYFGSDCNGNLYF